ncbi:MAG: RNA-binding cell elongation regulator Jag/EloR [Bacillota bacterium]|jgi:spoIIIJ-associated protein
MNSVKTVVEKTGRTVQEALNSAVAELGVSVDEVTVEVLTEPTRGFLGILGGREARVRVTLQKTVTELAKEFVSGVLERMGIEASIETLTAKESVTLNVVGENMGILIGRRGETLKCLEFLTGIVSGNGRGPVRRVFVDAAGYRKRRERELAAWAASAARRVRRMGKPVVMEPMDARDRRVVHVALQDEPGIATYSEGQEPFRRVVVTLEQKQAWAREEDLE